MNKTVTIDIDEYVDLREGYLKLIDKYFQLTIKYSDIVNDYTNLRENGHVECPAERDTTHDECAKANQLLHKILADKDAEIAYLKSHPREPLPTAPYYQFCDARIKRCRDNDVERKEQTNE